MLQQQENKKTTEIKAPGRDSRIRLTPEEIESLKASTEKGCLCYDAATSSWEGTCVP